MTGTNIPEGHLRAFEALTRGDYDKLRDQAGIVADVRLHDLRHSCASWPSNVSISLHLFFFSCSLSSNSHRIQFIS